MDSKSNGSEMGFRVFNNHPQLQGGHHILRITGFCSNPKHTGLEKAIVADEQTVYLFSGILVNNEE